MQASKTNNAAEELVSPLHFARFEFKYILSAKKRNQVEQDLNHFLDYDPFVRDRENHRYFVRSLYYDDDHYSAFHDKIDGLHTRSKFRVRTYSRDLDTDSPFFLEIKGRHNNLVYKHRTPIAENTPNWRSMKGEMLSRQLLKLAEPSEVRTEFEFQLHKRRIKPVALIDYERCPYISKYDPDFRITFDEALRATYTDGLFPGVKATSKRVLSGYTIVEVKFKYHLPSWFHQVIQAHELRRVSVSKIVSGMETLGLARDENG